MRRYSIYQLLLVVLLAISLAGCSASAAGLTSAAQGAESAPTAGEAAGETAAVQPVQEAESGGSASKAEPASGTSDASHSSDTDPDYAVVFPQESVNRIDITLSAEAWAALQTEMTEQFGEQGSGGQMGGRGQMPAGQGFGAQPPGGFQGEIPPGGGGMGAMGGMNAIDFGETSYVSSEIQFNGETWEGVGFRYSGNSTLQSSWSSGTQKISFRLDFDEFEDENPATTDQRFYGFKQISFKSNAMDDSYLREKVVADIFREAGVVSSQTAFYEVYIDHGDGPQYYGIYTAVEIVDDTVIETQFSDDSGNVYKPEGSGAAFVEGTFSEESFEKQTNEDEADWSDIQAVFAALNADTRTSDPAAWRAGLEAVFDVDAFIRWLAVDTIVQNWDTYGSMAHNYYLYTDPTDGLVTWIPWDNNMALSASGTPGGNAAVEEGSAAVPGRNGPGGMGRGVRELDLSAVGEQWPLVRYLMDDPVYLAKYQQYLAETIDGAFQPQTLAATYQKYHDLIAPYVEKEEEGFTQRSSIEAFDQALAGLIQHASQRYDAVVAYLAGN